MKSLKFVLSAVVLSVGLMAQAQADTESKTKVISNPLSDGDVGYFANALDRGTSFTDTLKFTLSGQSNIVGLLDLLLLNPSSFSATLTGPGSLSQSFSPGVFHFNDLAGGDYTMSFAGSTNHFGGAYATLFRVTAAVPEADTWLMILIGAGLVVFQLRRKQKSLQHRPLAAA